MLFAYMPLCFVGLFTFVSHLFVFICAWACALSAFFNFVSICLFAKSLNSPPCLCCQLLPPDSPWHRDSLLYATHIYLHTVLTHCTVPLVQHIFAYMLYLSPINSPTVMVYFSEQHILTCVLYLLTHCTCARNIYLNILLVNFCVQHILFCPLWHGLGSPTTLRLSVSHAPARRPGYPLPPKNVCLSVTCTHPTALCV